MNIKYCSLVVLFLCFTFTTYSQRKWYDNSPRKSEINYTKRMYWGISLPMAKLLLDQHFTMERPLLPYIGPSVDTTILIRQKNIRKIGIKGAIGIMGGTCFKIAKTSNTSMVALDLAACIDLYNYNVGFIRYSKADSVNDKLLSFLSSVPISLMYKSGGEASLDKANTLLFSIGAGFCPTFSRAVYGQIYGGDFKLRTFLVSEIGVPWIKLRASYYPASITYIDDTYIESAGPGLPQTLNLTVKASGSGSFVLSLLILFNTSMWDDNGY